jgi:hypothetical protein
MKVSKLCAMASMRAAESSAVSGQQRKTNRISDAMGLNLVICRAASMGG